MSISRVQTGTGGGSGSTLTITLSSNPIEGNLLVAIAFGRTNITAGPSGWERVVTCDPSASFVNDCAIWIKVAGSSEGTSYQWTLSGSNQSSGIIREYEASDGWPAVLADIIDVTAFTNSSGATTSRSSGTTDTSTQADALAVAGFGARGTLSGQSFTNSFGDLTHHAAGSPVAHSHLVDRIVAATGQYETTMSWTSGSQEAGGVIAVLLPTVSAPTFEGTIAVTIGSVTAEATGQSAITGSIAVTLSDVTSDISGTSTPPPAIGTIAVTLSNDTMVAAGTSAVVGSVATTLTDDVLDAAGVSVPPPVTGSLDVTLAGTTLTATGSYSEADFVGFVNVTLEPSTLSASGQSAVVGTMTPSLGDTSSAISGTSTAPPITGSLASTLEGVDLVASGTSALPVVTGTLAATLDDTTFTASGVFIPVITGTIAVTLDHVTSRAGQVLAWRTPATARLAPTRGRTLAPDPGETRLIRSGASSIVGPSGGRTEEG